MRYAISATEVEILSYRGSPALPANRAYDWFKTEILPFLKSLSNKAVQIVNTADQVDVYAFVEPWVFFMLRLQYPEHFTIREISGIYLALEVSKERWLHGIDKTGEESLYCQY